MRITPARPANTIVNKSIWERAEIDRSASEAMHTADADLVADEANIRRYLRPPSTTMYPLEFSYALLGDGSGGTVLDFGCGSGENTFILARRGKQVIGLDISESLIGLARRRLAMNGMVGTGRFIVGSGHDLPLADESVDLVFGIAVLHHLDISVTSREVWRVLKPGGRGIFQEPVRDSRVIGMIRKLIPYRAADISPFERPLTTSEITAFSRPFRQTTIRAFSLPFVNLIQIVRALRKYTRSAYRVDAALIRRIPAIARFASIRVIEVRK
jgi:ubiquinone/menaquinone biosynthesis C-methylase UbiE